MSFSVSRFTRTLSGVAAGAMVLAGISLVAVAPANAESEACTTTSTVTATNQDTNGWSFVGSGATGHNDFVAGGLHVWTESNTSTDVAVGYRAVSILLEDAGVPSLNLKDVTDLRPGLQLLTDFDGDGTIDGNLVGETVYGNGDDYWVSPFAWDIDESMKARVLDEGGGFGSKYHGTLDLWSVNFATANILGIGYGLTPLTLDGGGSTLESITVGCTTYAFAEDTTYDAPTSTEFVKDSGIRPNEVTYTGWHDGAGVSPRAYSTQINGLHFGNGHKAQIINGFDTPLETTELESLITSASVSVVDGSVTYQIPILYGTRNNGAGTFTTIRSTSLATGNHNFSVSDTWLASGHLKNNAGTLYREDLDSGDGIRMPLADLVAFLNAQGNVRVLAVGAQAADGSAVMQDLVFNGTKYTFVPTSAAATTNTVRVTEPEIALTETGNYLKWHEGNGREAYEDTAAFSVAENGLHLVIDPDGPRSKSQIMKGLDTPVAGADLYSLLTSMAGVSVVSGEVTYQVAVNFTDGWSTLRSASLGSGDHTFSLTDPWISSKAIGSSISAEISYPLGDILDAMNALGAAEGIGFGVSTGIPAVVSSIVWGDTTYHFVLQAPPTPPSPPAGTTTGDVVAGGILASDPVGTVPTTSNPVVVSITSPVAGTVTIVKGSTSPTLTGYKTLGINSQISAPPSTADQPLKLKFQVYVGDLPGGTYPSDVNVFRDSIAIPACPGASTASPDPCISDSSIASGVETFTVLSSHASSWDLQAANVGRLAGADRYETALAISQSDFPSGNAGAVILADGENYPDALVAAPLAVDKNAPLLLTTGSSLRPDVKAELQRVLPAGGTVYILGGTSAVPAGIASQVTDLGYQVIRYAGANRFATAVKIAGALGNRETVLLASGTKFPDALSAGVAAAKAGGVVLLTNGTSLPATTSSYLTAHGRTVYAVGGPAAAAKSNATPLVGAGRYATSVAVAKEFFPNPSSVGVASGTVYADALSGGPLLARAGVPLVLAAPGILPLSVGNYLSSLKSNVTSAHLFGDSDALEVAVQTAVGRALGL